MFSFNITKKYHKIVHMNWMTSMTVQFVNKSLLWSNLWTNHCFELDSCN